LSLVQTNTPCWGIRVKKASIIFVLTTLIVACDGPGGASVPDAAGDADASDTVSADIQRDAAEDADGTPDGLLAKQLTSGAWHTCALALDDTVYCWGAGSDPTEYENTQDYHQSVPPSGTFLDISAADLHTCGVRTSGDVICWGSNNYGQAETPDGEFVDVEAGSYHDCALDADGNAVCWGTGTAENTPESEVDFDQAVPPDQTFEKLAAGDRHTCGLTTTGGVLCWGLGSEDSGFPEGKFDFNQAMPPSGTYQDLAAGYFHTCALDDAGEVTCWGLGVDPDLDETDEAARDFDQGVAPGGPFESIAAAAFHTCGVRPDGSIDCWGAGDQEGAEGTPYDHKQAVPPSGSFISVSPGNFHGCALREDQTFECWGAGSEGDRKAGDYDFDQSIPKRTDVTAEPCHRVDSEPFDGYECSPLCQRGCSESEVCVLGSGPQVGLVASCNPAGAGTQGEPCDSETLTCAPGYGCREDGVCTRFCRADSPLGPACPDGLECYDPRHAVAGFCVQ
jgi:alpha-tubulin suppressor-like RCC1 family protein